MSRRRCRSCGKTTRREGGICFHCQRDLGDLELTGGRWELGPGRVQRWVADEPMVAPRPDVAPEPDQAQPTGCADCGRPRNVRAKRCGPCATDAIRASWRASQQRRRQERVA